MTTLAEFQETIDRFKILYDKRVTGVFYDPKKGVTLTLEGGYRLGPIARGTSIERRAIVREQL